MLPYFPNLMQYLFLVIYGQSIPKFFFKLKYHNQGMTLKVSMQEIGVWLAENNLMTYIKFIWLVHWLLFHISSTGSMHCVPRSRVWYGLCSP